MFKRLFFVAAAFACFFSLAAPAARGQREIPRETTTRVTTYHQVEGRVQYRGGRLGGVRVRLVKLPEMRKVGETFTRPEGQFTFQSVLEGEYAVETVETEEFEAVAAGVSVRPLQRDRATTFTVMVDLRPKASAPAPAPGVVSADVDLDVPKEAQKRYRAGMKAVEKQDGAAAVKELRAAVEAHPPYYAARLALARELRAQKRLEEADEVLRPLPGIAPRRAEPRVERGVVLLGLGRHSEAAEQLEQAVKLEETNWAAHFYL
ncbi:MAG TPA: tetratricopeptide repeat protein, partial [Pyrinomonadaceae bacterium]|nr:tetratricopeptide repeat protein [Pyrinomonadaceae bacterium]